MVIHFILFYFVMCSQHLSLLSLAGHRDKLKIKSMRKIIYKSTSQARAFYPYCYRMYSPQEGENPCSPSSSPPLVWGRLDS